MARVVKKFIPEAPVTKGGSWGGSTNLAGTLLQVIIQPKSQDTIYNIGIKDEDGMLIYVKYDIKGTLTDSGLDIVVMPGEKRIILEDVTKDEPFSIKLIYQL